MNEMISPSAGRDLLEDGLEPLLELAAVLRAGDHRTEVERDQPLAAQPLRHVALDDPTGEALDDRGLADTGLADEDGVVLRAARQHLDHAPDLFVATDHRVDAALTRVLGEVAAVLLERLVLLFGIVGRDAMTSAHALQRLEHAVVRDTRAAQQVADAAGHLGHREQHVLGREVLVVERGALLVGRFEEAVRVGRETGLAHRRSADPRSLRERLVEVGEERAGNDPDALEHTAHHAFGRGDERAEHVLARDLGVPAARARRPGRRRALRWSCV